MVKVFLAKKFKFVAGLLVYFLLGIFGDQNFVLCYEANGNVVLEFAETGSCHPDEPSDDPCGPCVDLPVLTRLFNQNRDFFKEQVFSPSVTLTVFVKPEVFENAKTDKVAASPINSPSRLGVILLI